MENQNCITLRGSAKIVAEFFDEFERTKKYDLPVFITTNPSLRQYLDKFIPQIEEWLSTCEIKRFVLVIMDVDTNEPRERWNFDIETDKEVAVSGSDKDLKEIVAEIKNIIRQITACVSFLPVIECPCVFDILVYTDKDSVVPKKWEESAPKYIENSEEVKLRYLRMIEVKNEVFDWNEMVSINSKITNLL